MSASMFRGGDAVLQWNWLHVPIEYHSRSSSIDIGGSLLSLGAMQWGGAPSMRPGHDQPRHSLERQQVWPNKVTRF
jgi:hypothetical protein